MRWGFTQAPLPENGSPSRDTQKGQGVYPNEKGPLDSALQAGFAEALL